MQILKRLITVSSLLFVLGGTCMADNSTCSQDPGQTSTPPCPLVYTIGNAANPGEMQPLAATGAVDILAIGEIALGTFLSLY